MNDPLVLMFAMFVVSLLLVVAGVAIWSIGYDRRVRLTHALNQLGEILKLTDEALQSRSPEKQNSVNSRIAEWDEKFSRDCGLNIPQLSWTPALS
jgi:hypothetical protein